MDYTYVEERSKTINGYINKVFMWLCIGLIISFGSSLFWENIIPPTSGFMVSIIAGGLELLCAIYLSKAVFNMNPAKAKVLYVVYCLMTGFTLGLIIGIYTPFSVSLALFITAIFFGVLALIGAYTKVDLTRIGNICLVGLFVYIIASIIMMLLHINSFIMPFISLALFTGITAWDMQKIIKFYYEYEHNELMLESLAIYGAFELLLDFINIFIDILNIIGDSN